MACEVCDRLWRSYESAVFEHVRLCSKLKLALATNSDDRACEDLASEVHGAENKRSLMRAALLKHEAACGHGATSSLASPAV